MAAWRENRFSPNLTWGTPMCSQPVLVKGVYVACRECKQCRRRKRFDYVGRCIAESKTAVASHRLTLTFGEDDKARLTEETHERFLRYRDIELYLKRLRYHVKREALARLVDLTEDERKVKRIEIDKLSAFRFFAAGEYGDAKGRAHWHVLLFWQMPPISGIIPKWRYDHKVSVGAEKVSLWPHGFSYWEDLQTDLAGGVGYVVSYAQKKIGKDNPEKAFGYSSKPPLGDLYFRNMAKRHVDQGISPRDLTYSFPEVKWRGKPQWFKLFGASAYNYCEAFIEGWRERYGNEDWPASTLIEEFLDLRAVENERIDIGDMFARASLKKDEGRVWLENLDVEGRKRQVSDQVVRAEVLEKFFEGRRDQ